MAPNHRTRGFRVVIAILLVSMVAVSAPAVASKDSGDAGAGKATIEQGPPSSAECRSQVGTTGLLYLNGIIPTPGSVDGTGGFGKPASAVLKLPRSVMFKDSKHSFSDRYAFAVRRGNLYVRQARKGLATQGSRWYRLQLPSCLAGNIASVSADGNMLTVVGPERQLYTHDMPGGSDLSPERWTWRWGPYFWTGSGIKLPSDAPTIAASELASTETFTDTAGRKHNAIGVMTGYLLRGDRTTITYIDPWLASDESREVCGPRRGTAKLRSLDATGSTVFVLTNNGDLYTRLYDFDISGANYVFGTYNWRDKAPDPNAWQVPGPQWRKQPRPPGTFTSRLSIATTAADVSGHRLRVEGRDNRGRTGYWSKTVDARSWRFYPANQRISGRIVTPTKAAPVNSNKDRTYRGTVGGKRAVVSGFNPDCSPAKIRVKVSQTASLELELLSADALRQARRERGLDDVPRWYNAAVVVPASTWRTMRNQPAEVRRFVSDHLAGRITPVPLTATATRLRVEQLCWDFTLNGKPARPDQRGEPDPAVQFGTLLAAARELPGRPPSVCGP